MNKLLIAATAALTLAGCGTLSEAVLVAEARELATEAACAALLAEVDRFDPDHTFDDIERHVLRICETR